MAKTKKTSEAAPVKETAKKVSAVKADETAEMAAAAKAAAQAAKAAKTETVEVKTEEAAPEKKAPAKKVAPAKKAVPKKVAPKKPASVAAKIAKPEEMKSEVKVETKTETQVAFFVEYNGKQVSVDEVIKNVKLTNGKEAKNIAVYLKPEEQKAYFVADGEEKEMDVYFC